MLLTPVFPGRKRGGLKFTDEPTGNLDAHTRDEIMDIFLRLGEAGRCIIIVTYSAEVSHQADHVYHLERMKRA